MQRDSGDQLGLQCLEEEQMQIIKNKKSYRKLGVNSFRGIFSIYSEKFSETLVFKVFM